MTDGFSIPETTSTEDDMNVIDISSWQKGIDLAALFSLNSLNAVICKATEGTRYTNLEFKPWMDWLTANNKPFGFYHFLAGGDANSEAEYFYNATQEYVGKGIPVADFEGYALGKGSDWLKQFLDRYEELTGVKAMIYCSLSVVSGLTGMTDHPLWIAQYADMEVVNGFLTTPWQSGSVSPWDKFWMHQYTGNGRLKGYGSALDLDKFYGTPDEWAALARGNKVSPPSMYKPVDPIIIGEVLDGKHGTGVDRVLSVRQAGYDPDAVQRKINRLYLIGGRVREDIGDEMEYINPIIKIARSKR